MTPNTNLGSMKWSEIPSETPVTALMSAVGFPEPMVILKHLSKPKKNGKKPDLNTIVQIMWLTKGEIDEFLSEGCKAIARNSKIHIFMLKHPKYSLHIAHFLQQVQNEPLSVIAERTLNVWIKELVEEQAWDNLMSETPLTLLDKLVKQFSDEDFLNTTIGEYYEMFDIESKLEKASISAIGDSFVRAEEREKAEKELAELLKNSDIDSFFEALMKSSHSPFTSPQSDDDSTEEEDEN